MNFKNLDEAKASARRLNSLVDSAWTDTGGSTERFRKRLAELLKSDRDICASANCLDHELVTYIFAYNQNADSLTEIIRCILSKKTSARQHYVYCNGLERDELITSLGRFAKLNIHLVVAAMDVDGPGLCCSSLTQEEISKLRLTVRTSNSLASPCAIWFPIIPMMADSPSCVNRQTALENLCVALREDMREFEVIAVTAESFDQSQETAYQFILSEHSDLSKTAQDVFDIIVDQFRK